MAVLALNCPDIQVTVVDINEIQISKWNSSDLSQLPVYEPGLSEIVSQTRFKNLHFSTDLEGSIRYSISKPYFFSRIAPIVRTSFPGVRKSAIELEL